MSEEVAIYQAPEISGASAVLETIARAARDPATDVAKMVTLFEMYEKMQAKQAEQAFFAGMRDAQNRMRAVVPHATNAQTRSLYATYAAIDREIRPIYSDAGFALSFNTEEAGEATVKVVCVVSHVGGHSRKYALLMPADGKGAKGGDVMTKTHATGSAVSYGMRYLLKMIFNVAVGELPDDDGNAAGTPTNLPPVQREPEPLPEYPQAAFDKNFPAWAAAISAGIKTAENKIAQINTKYTLTQAQIDKISGIGQMKQEVENASAE